MPLQQIAVLSPKNLMEASDGKQTEEKTDRQTTSENNSDVAKCDIVTQNDGNGDVDKDQTEAALETCVKVKTCAGAEKSTDETSDTSTEGRVDNPDNATVQTVNETERNTNAQSTDTRRSGKRAKKEKPSPVKKKETQETLHADSPKPVLTERCDSSLSTNSVDVCRICQCDTCEIQSDSPTVTPCLCSGSLKNVHQACLQKWIKSSDKMKCELCMFEYHLTKKTKPLWEWEKLDMTPAERRKVVCSVTFHVIAITCVIWSLYVLIDRTTEEVEAGSLLWPFWTKLIVVAIGFTGGVVFMYVQCKMYLTLCKKWRTYNKVILIESISETERDVANQAGLIKLREKEKQLGIEPGTDFEMFSVVNETNTGNNAGNETNAV